MFVVPKQLDLRDSSVPSQSGLALSKVGITQTCCVGSAVLLWVSYPLGTHVERLRL